MKTEILTPLPWVDALNRYFGELRSGDISAGTIKQYGYQLRRFASETKLLIHEVRHDDLVDFVGNPLWSTNTRRTARSALRSFFKWAKVQKLVKKNPAKHLPSGSYEIGVPRPASEAAIAHGLRTSQRRVALMIQLAAQAGLRCREIARVHPGNDLVEDLDGWSLVVHGKGNKRRVVPLNADLARQLRDAPEGWLFPGQIEGHLSDSYVSKLISRELPADTTAHPLRHRFASVVYKGTNHDIRAVQDLLGHASVATTQIYTAVPAESKRRGVEAAA